MCTETQTSSWLEAITLADTGPWSHVQRLPEDSASTRGGEGASSEHGHPHAKPRHTYGMLHRDCGWSGDLGPCHEQCSQQSFTEFGMCEDTLSGASKHPGTLRMQHRLPRAASRAENCFSLYCWLHSAFPPFWEPKSLQPQPCQPARSCLKAMDWLADNMGQVRMGVEPSQLQPPQSFRERWSCP